jgi:hypothetical protein
VLLVVIAGEVARRKKKNQHFFKLEEFVVLSQGGDPYAWVCAELLPCVVGWKAWNKKKIKERLSEIATCSDESFLLLTLENNYSRWLAEATWIADNKDTDPPERAAKDFPESRYTNSGTSRRNGRSKWLHGWAREGYLRFNELYKLVAKDRLHRALFEKELMTTVCAANSRVVVVDDASDDDDIDIFPANDLDGLSGPIIHGRDDEGDDDDDDDDDEN